MTVPFRRTLADREDVLGGAMLAPALAYVILLVGVPFAFAIVLGFSNATAGSLSFGWAGLANYQTILGDPIFLRALRNSVIVTVGSQVLVVILATAAAQVFRTAFLGRRVARFVLLLPWAVPVSLAAIAWTWIFDSTFSVINWTLKAAGLLHGWLYWLGDPALALLAIIIVQAWRIFPFATVIVLAGLSSIPQEIVEAAIVDGAGFWRRLFRVELPLLLPVVAVAVLFGVVYTATVITTTATTTTRVFRTQRGKSVCPRSSFTCSSVGGSLKIQGMWLMSDAPTYRSRFCLNDVTSIQ